MVSVTRRIKQIKQPWGGYIKRKDFEVTEINDNNELNLEENIHASLVGLAVDYMTRFMMGASIKDAFKISIEGANIKGESKIAQEFLSQIKGLDNKSIICACKLSGYDVCYRAGIENYKPVTEINPDKETVENISIMIKRSMFFWEEYGPIVKDLKVATQR